MEDLAVAAKTVAGFVETLTTTGGMRLKYRVVAGAGAADPDGLEQRELYVEMKGPDAQVLTARGGEVLRAMEHVAAQILRLEPTEHDRVSFDADNFKADRAEALLDATDEAIERVRQTGQPYSFAPMSSRERRMVHLALRRAEDLRSESSGEGRERFVVLYPKDWTRSVRAQQTRSAFRPRSI